MSIITPPTVTAGNTMQLTIDALATGGQAIARLDGMVIFVDRGLPGQTVQVTITRVKKRFAEATLDRVITRTATEATPFCKHFSLCGGCHWQHLPYAEQLEWKRRFVEDSMRRIGGAEGITVPSVIPSPKQLFYRNKMEFAFLQGRGVIHLGLRRTASHSIVNIEECYLQSERSTSILTHVREWANSHELLNAFDPKSCRGFLRFLVVRETKHTNQLTVQIITAPDWSGKGLRNAAVAQLGKELAERHPQLTGFVHSERTSKSQVAYGEGTILLQGSEEMNETMSINGTQLSLGIGGADAFFQTNTEAAEALYSKALQFAALTGTETVWDLYCGVGALSLAAASSAKQVVGFELSESAVDAARRNAQNLKITNATFHAGDVLHTLKNEPSSPDVLITDPPRSGMHPAVVAAIADHKPQRIIFIACDPATQSRDIGLLLTDYSVEAIQPVDLFPHTPHIENIVLLHRNTISNEQA